jgi:hypothetical protein
MKLLLTLCLCLIVIGVRLAEAATSEPQVNIPRISDQTAKNIIEAVDFKRSDWQQAAEIRQFNRPNGGSCIPKDTVFYLQHDGKQLLAAALCYDNTMKGQALERQPDEDLTQDEAVQVVLGVGGDVPVQRLEMGGYEGAQGQVIAPVAHFYEYTCNAVGSISRRYNETSLPNPGFTARTGRFSDGWFAIFQIPLASAGISDAEGHMFYFNLFRFYKTERYGWYIPHYGNYYPLTFGKARFLSINQNDLRTIEKAPPKPQPKSKAVVTPVTFPPKISFYPLSRTLVAEYPSDATQRIAELRLDGTELETTCKLSADRSSVLKLKVSASISQKEIVGITGIRQKNKTLLNELRKTFTIPTSPVWYGTTAGSEYVEKKVPYPWKTPIVENGTLVLSHAKIKFDGALPSGIVVKEKALLDGPVQVQAVINGKTVPVINSVVTREEPTRTLFSSESGKGLQVRTMIEYDGFMVVRMRLEGFNARQLEHLDVRIPLVENVVKYINRGSAQDTLNLHGHGYIGNASELWAGNESMGLSFSYDRQCFFSKADGRQIEIVQLPNGKAEILLHLVSGAGQVKDPVQVFQFFLLPTPTRGDVVPPMVGKLDLWFEEWSDYQSYPDLTKLPAVKKRSAKDHAAGKSLYMYFGHAIAENSPDFDTFRNELVTVPTAPLYRRGYDPGKGVSCYLCCFREAAGDLLLDGINTLMTQGNIDGIYMDGPTVPCPCANPTHKCDDNLPAVWDGDWDQGRIVGQRRFLKRLRGLFDAKGYRFPLWAHTGGGLNFPTLSLCDFYWEGEQLNRYRDGYLLESEKFLVGYTGKPFGFRGMFLSSLYVDATGVKRGLPWSLLHDTEIKPHCGVGLVTQDLFFDLPHRDSSARFFPYWESQPQIKIIDGSLPVSYYLGKDEAVLVVSNLRYAGTQTVRIDVGGMFPSKKLNITSINDRSFVAVTGNQFSVNVPESQTRVFRITPVTEDQVKEVSVPEPQGEPVYNFKSITSYDLNDWIITGKLATGANPDFKLPLTIGSEGKKGTIVAELKSRLPEDFTAVFSLINGGKFKISIDNVDLVYYQYGGYDRWEVIGLDPWDQEGKCLAKAFVASPTEVVPNRPVEFEIIYKAGRMTIFYDGRCLVERSLPAKQFRSHQLKFSVSDGHCIGLDVKSITPEAKDMTVPNQHPIP